MNLKRSIAVLIVLFAIVEISFAQQLQTPTYSYSKKKPAYITLSDGVEVEGTIKDVDRKKGQIDEVKIKTADGKKASFKAEDIKYMYLPQSGLDKFSQATEMLGDARRWKSSTLDPERMKKGYVYTENTLVKIKKKERILLMQLLNTSYSDKVKIYADPFAGETASVGIGGVTLAGGLAKSYYFKKGDGPAVIVTKKSYSKMFNDIWADCPAIIEKYGENIKWSDFTNHVFDYTNDCE